MWIPIFVLLALVALCVLMLRDDRYEFGCMSVAVLVFCVASAVMLLATISIVFLEHR